MNLCRKCGKKAKYVVGNGPLSNDYYKRCAKHAAKFIAGKLYNGSPVLQRIKK